MLLYNFFFISILIFNSLNDIPEERPQFVSPVNISLALSANFGELRADHFHSGIDIKTQGVTGKEIVAVASGYVYRISVSPGGFGKALYLRHPSGYSTVYGHLDRFIPEIEEYITDQQYEKKSFTVTVFPPKEKFTVNQGDLIAYSGNSGSSGGPHLHYEVRRSESETPVNPLSFEFGTGDNIVPVIERLVIYPINRHTLINEQNKITRVNIAGGNGNYYIPPENVIKINGIAGFGIKSYDLLNDSYNKCSVYSIELKIDSITRFRYQMDEFSFNESKYINSHIDYETYMRDNTYMERTFVLPNDKLSVYEDVIDRGVFDFNDGKMHHIEIILADAHGNISTLVFNAINQDMVAKQAPPEPDKNKIVMPYNRSNRFRAENISISIPAGALYDTIAFSYQKDTGTPLMYSNVHYIHNRYTPVHKPFSISIKPTVIPEGKESKLLLVQLSDDFKMSALNSRWTDGYVTADAPSFGMFYIGIDTIGPVISSNGLTSGVILTGKNEIRIRIMDELSGIKSYTPVIDGEWALFEYDQKNNVLIYKFDPKRIAKDSNHILELEVTDNKDNKSLYGCDFRW